MVFDGKFTKSLNSEGLTLIEVLISISILILLFSSGPFISTKILKDYQISQESNYLVGNLRFLQYLSLYQKNDCSYGIKFLENKYLFLKKYPDGETEAFKSHFLPQNLKIEGPSEIIFEKNTGKPSWSGIVRIIERTNEGIILQKREIDINSEGNIEILK